MPRHQEFEAAPRERLEELLLRSEQDVHRARRRSGLSSDIADGDGVDAALGDEELGGGEELVTRGVVIDSGPSMLDMIPQRRYGTTIRNVVPKRRSAW